MAVSFTDHLWDFSGNITSTGSVNAYVIKVAMALAGYHVGMPPIRFKANFTNSGAATINIASQLKPLGLGARSLRRVGGGVLSSGDIEVGGLYTIVFDGVNFQVCELGGSGGGGGAGTLPAFDVRDYGAVGDGTTDDAGAFQDAIDAAKAANDYGTVFVPHSADKYVIGASVVVPSGITILGQNRRGLELSGIKPEPGFTDPIFTSFDYGNSRILRAGLVGLFIDGSSTTLTAIAMNCQEGVFRDVCIKNCFTYGIHLGGVGSGTDEQALNNTIEACFIAGQIGIVEFYEGLFLDYNTADTRIIGNYIEACSNACIRSRAYNDLITGANHLYFAPKGYYSETSTDKIFSGNYVENISQNGVYIDGGGSDVGALNATIHSNSFRNIGSGGSGVIELTGTFVDVVSISGNVLRADASFTGSVDYFAYFNGITPPNRAVYGNTYDDGFLDVAEHNLDAGLPVGLTLKSSTFLLSGTTEGSGKRVGFDIEQVTGTRSFSVPDLDGRLALVPVVTSAAPSADQDNYDPTGWSADVTYDSILRLAPTASILVTGLARGASGRRVMIANATDPAGSGARMILLPHEASASSAANRFSFSDRMPRLLFPGDTIALWYDNTSTRWREVQSKPYWMAFEEFTDDLFTLDWYSSGTAGAQTGSGSYLSGNSTQKPRGIIDLETGTDAAGYAGAGQVNLSDIVPTSGMGAYLSRVAVQTLSTGTQRYRLFNGFNDNASATTVSNGCYWDYQEEADSHWRMCTADGGSRTETATAITVDTNYIWLGVFVNGDWSRADFFSSQNGATWAINGSITTNMPDVGDVVGSNILLRKTVGTTNRKASMDMMAWRQNAIRGS